MVLLLQRVSLRADAMSDREVLEIATLGGAAVLGRAADCGSIEVGKRGDVAGAWDPVAGLVMCGPGRVRDLFVDGRGVVRDGRLVTIDLGAVVARQRALAARLMG